MNDLELLLGYILWGIIIVFTIALFKYFSKKFANLFLLSVLVLPLSWIGVAIVRGILNIFLSNNFDVFSLGGILMFMAEIFASFVLLGVTFAVMYVKLKKGKNKIQGIQ